MSMGVATSFLSGSDEATSLQPTIGVEARFSYTSFFSKNFALSNRFGLGLLVGGENFAGAYGAYLGILGAYTAAFRFYIGKATVRPFLEFGPNLGFFIAKLSSDAVAKSQIALKYGYTIGTGFDWADDGGGWGIGINYFNYLSGPAAFDFPAGSQSAKGIAIELRFILAPKT